MDLPLIDDLGNKGNVIPEEIGDIEQEDFTEIEDLGDSYIINERKTIKKKEISYDDAKRFGLQNINCVGDCLSFSAPTVKNRYESGQKHCLICKIWINYDDGRNCPCCSSELRVGSK